MTPSESFQSGESPLNVRSLLPLLVGVGGGAALSYFLGGRKTDGGQEAGYQPTRQFTAQQTKTESIENKGRQEIQDRPQQFTTETRQTAADKKESTGRYVIKPSANGKFYFNLKGANGETVLWSELYDSRSAAEKGIESVKKNAADANHFERKLNEKNEPYFALKAGNGEIIAISEGYSSASAMEDAVSFVMRSAPEAEISRAAS
jgi:uncharacterized protein YegP (UPF0339 family)